MRTTSVLVVEDDRALLRVLTDSLRDDGFAVTDAADGEQALTALATSEPDVLLLDITLPDMEAAELVAQMTAVCERVPIVLMSGWSHARIAEASEAIGAAATLRKPFDLDEMVATVRSAATAS